MSKKLSERRLENALNNQLVFKKTGVSLESDNVDPTVTLVEAKAGSLFMSKLTGKLYQKQTDLLDLDWVEIPNLNDIPSGGGAVDSVNGQTGVVVLDKDDVGLGNVPNVDATLRSNHTGTQLASTISDFTSAARTASVADAISDGVTNIAPSQNAVFDALSLKADQTSLNAHINDTSDAHDASAISVIAQNGITSTDVQSALEELQGEITAIVPGEVNTASNVGAGSQVFKQKTGVDLEFRTLTAGSNITLTQNANDITIAATGSSGANTSLSNLTSPVAFNQSLIPDTNNARNIGSATRNINETYSQYVYSYQQSSAILDSQYLYGNSFGSAPVNATPSIDLRFKTLLYTAPSGGSGSPAAPGQAALFWDNGIYVPRLGGGNSQAFGLQSGDGFRVNLKAPNTIPSSADLLFQFPNSLGTSGQVLTTDGTGVTSWATPSGSGANTTLSNLTSPTSINQDLLPASDQVQSLGSDTKTWSVVYANILANNLGQSVLNIENRTLDIPSQNVASWSSAGFNLKPDPGGNQRKFAIERNAVKYEITIPNITLDREFRLPINGGTSGQRLATDGTGVTSWTNRTVIESGNTASRPASPVTGETFLDLTINKPIWYNGTNWIDATGTIV